MVGRSLYILYGLFLLTMYLVIGPHFEGESLKYIHAAEELSIDKLFEVFGQYKFFFTHIVYIKVILVVFKHKFWIAFFNIVLSIVGAELVFKSARELFISTRAAYVAKALTLFCYPVQFWTLSAYSEPLFIFLSILLFYLLVVNKATFLPVLFTCILLIFTRPQGLFFVCFFLTYHFSQVVSFNVLKVSLVCAVPLVLGMLFLDAPEKELRQVLYAEPILVSEHKQVDLSDSISNTFQTYTLLIDQLGWKKFLLLEGEKTIFFFIMCRNYYSLSNNFIYGFFTVYLLAGIFTLSYYFKRHRNLVIALFFILFFHLMVALVFWNTWHNRFNILLLPILSIFIAGAIDDVLLRNSRSVRKLTDS